MSRKIEESLARARLSTLIRCSSVGRMKKLLAVQMNQRPTRTQAVR